MRRKKKAILAGAGIIGGITSLVDILMQWNEHSNNGKPFTWDSYDGKRTLQYGLIGAGVGALAGYAYDCYRLKAEEELPFNPDNYLKKVLSEESLKADPDKLSNMINIRNEIKETLVRCLGNKLAARPEDTGSFSKGTAICSNCDLDIVLPFKKNSYITLEEMYHSVYEIISEALGGKAKVFKQTKAIGLVFQKGGTPIYLDIVPGREINNYAIEKDLNLYVNPEWSWQRGSSFKTNVNTQKRIVVKKPAVRTTIKLLKIYRDRNSLSLPSLIIEQCVTEALSQDNYGISTSPLENLLNSMAFIAKKLGHKTIIDIANSNNNLHDKLTDFQKNQTAELLINDVLSIEKNYRYVKEIFEC